MWRRGRRRCQAFPLPRGPAGGGGAGPARGAGGVPSWGTLRPAASGTQHSTFRGAVSPGRAGPAPSRPGLGLRPVPGPGPGPRDRIATGSSWDGCAGRGAARWGAGTEADRRERGQRGPCPPWGAPASRLRAPASGPAASAPPPPPPPRRRDPELGPAAAQRALSDHAGERKTQIVRVNAAAAPLLARLLSPGGGGTVSEACPRLYRVITSRPAFRSQGG